MARPFAEQFGRKYSHLTRQNTVQRVFDQTLHISGMNPRKLIEYDVYIVYGQTVVQFRERHSQRPDPFHLLTTIEPAETHAEFVPRQDSSKSLKRKSRTVGMH